MLALHFDRTKGAETAASIHQAGCQHGNPRSVVVVEIGADLDDAQRHPEVVDLRERGWTVKLAPCLRRREIVRQALRVTE